MTTAKLTILVDDFNGAENGFVTSYGFSVLIEIDKRRILFDTGTNVKPLMKNLKEYGISNRDLNAIILSHNHYDHTDGLPGILKDNPDIPVYIHKDWDEPASYKGFQVPQKNRVVVETGKKYKEQSPEILITPSHWAPDYGGVYEHACFIKANEKYILLVGCCHPGLNQFLEDRTLLGISQDAPLYLIGGMHGFKFRDNEARELYPFVESLIICHCTADTRTFRNQFGGKCHNGIVGQTIEF